jgi:hypothetical protein
MVRELGVITRQAARADAAASRDGERERSVAAA